MTDPDPIAVPVPSVVEVRLVSLPLLAAHRSATDVVTDRATVVVRAVLDDGTEGWGECPALPRPTYTAEYAAGAFAVLRDEIAPGALAGRHEAVVGHAMARAGLADALLDAVLRREGTSMAAALGGRRASVETRAVVSSRDLDDLLTAVAARLDEGIGRIGLKVDPAWLLAPVGALRATWPGLGISIDGNGSLGGLGADTWRQLDAVGLDEIEQPCVAGDWIGSASVAARVGCPVALDESIGDGHDLETASTLRAGSVVNLKPARVGGVLSGARLARRAHELGFETYVGGLLESGVGRATALAVASIEACGRPTHLGPSDRYFARDLTDPIRLDASGRLVIPPGPGSGVTPDRARVDDATRRVVALERPTG